MHAIFMIIASIPWQEVLDAFAARTTVANINRHCTGIRIFYLFFFFPEGEHTLTFLSN